MRCKGFKAYIVTMFEELSIIVYHAFREGSAMGEVVEAINEAYKILPQGKRIKHTSLDSEFYSAEIITLLMSKRTTFCVVGHKDASVMEKRQRGLSNENHLDKQRQ
ncbi:MAG: hypothetical protein N3A59_04245 [Thermodesulfovibrionales bacterium]|nr:hypothetical protein [Thermodesulfovibrionales bacterium]